MTKSQNHTKGNITKYKRRYNYLMNKTFSLSDLALGTIQERFNTCGNLNCKCRKGEKHGPNYYLTFSSRKSGKMISLYLPKNDVNITKKRIRTFHKLQEYLEELLILELKIRQEDRH